MKEGAIAGEVELLYLDEAGFAPTLPTSYTWARAGVRATVAHEAPQRRRVNVIGAWAPLGAQPRFAYRSTAGKLDSAAFLAFLWHDVGGVSTPLGQRPPGFQRQRRCVVVLDNYGIHHSHAVSDARPALTAAGIELVYLPPYSPELNLIEALWRHVKHEQMPIRSYTTVQALQAAVDHALDQHVTIPVDCVHDLPQAA